MNHKKNEPRPILDSRFPFSPGDLTTPQGPYHCAMPQTVYWECWREALKSLLYQVKHQEILTPQAPSIYKGPSGNNCVHQGLGVFRDTQTRSNTAYFTCPTPTQLHPPSPECSMKTRTLSCWIEHREAPGSWQALGNSVLQGRF